MDIAKHHSTMRQVGATSLDTSSAFRTQLIVVTQVGKYYTQRFSFATRLTTAMQLNIAHGNEILPCIIASSDAKKPNLHKGRSNAFHLVYSRTYKPMEICT